MAFCSHFQLLLFLILVFFIYQCYGWFWNGQDESRAGQGSRCSRAGQARARTSRHDRAVSKMTGCSKMVVLELVKRAGQDRMGRAGQGSRAGQGHEPAGAASFESAGSSTWWFWN